MSENSPSVDVIQAWLVSKLSERLGIEPDEIDVREDFAGYGLGSMEAVSVAGELAVWLGRELSPALAYEHPTIETLARHLAKSPDTAEAAPETGRDVGGRNEPIAIVGIGCRFPGSNDPTAFWQMLREGVDAIRVVPADRFDQNAFYDPDPAAQGKMNTRWGGFLEQVDRFDASFFGIAPREALRMDPQQRLLLEVAWEALEDAGQVPDLLAGTQTGVFIGIATNDYGRLQWNDLNQIDAYAGTGNALSIAANRLSYLFDFRGPSLAIDTACSSSLVAVHLACASLRSGESTMALAGGVNLILSPAIAINFTKAGAMAPDGRSKSFDARADGYVRSEGAGVVVLKHLSGALDDGDPIYAVIRGSAVNQDGRSNGLMAPNPLAQEAVLREAYRKAAVSPGKVQYVEAHGTGTFLGDPIEAKALGTVLSIDRPRRRPCALGSVKANIGHLEAAAGIAGLIKVALALRHKEIPPSLHFEEPNPHIPFDDLSLRVNAELTPWPTDLGPALAGVSSFGFGGTNAHVVLEAAPPVTSEPPVARREGGTYLLPLSARSPEALRSLARAYQDHLTVPDAAAILPDVCYSASVRRCQHDHRLAVTGNSPDQLVESLEGFLRGETRPGLSSGRKPTARRRKLVFVFSGQGSQWLAMGQRLLDQEAVFRQVIEQCDRAMQPYGDWSLLAELTATDAAQSRLNEVDVVQPALFAIQIALATLWRSWGIEPQAVVGHSLGEVAGAHVAGALSFTDAVRVVCLRSRLFKRIIGQGAMAAVDLSIDEARRALNGSEDRVSIAANNGPQSTVLSGDATALAAIVNRLQRTDVFCRMLNVDFAAHSPQMEPLRAELLQTLEGLQPRTESVPIYSTVTGQVSQGLEFDSHYWERNMREPVLFATAVQHLMEDGHDVFLEISPHPILLSAIQQGSYGVAQGVAVLPSLRREEDERTVLFGSLGALYALGYPFDWSRAYPTGGRFIPLPLYPWQRERFWIESAAEVSVIHRKQEFQGQVAAHPLLGRHSEAPYPAGTHVWETSLETNALPYLNDHRIQGIPVLPASAYLEMGLAASIELFGEQPVVLKDIEFRKALFLHEGQRQTIQVVLSQGADESASLRIFSSAGVAAPTGKSWMLHASGKIALQQDDGIVAPEAGQEPVTVLRNRGTETISSQDFYARLRESGIDYGPFFQSVAKLWADKGDFLGEVRLPDSPETDFDGFRVHPAVLDAGLQIVGAAVAMEATKDGREGICMPTRIDRFSVHGRPDRHLWGHARTQHGQTNGTTGGLRILDDADRVAIELRGVRFEWLGEETLRAAIDDLDNWFYEFEWQTKERATGKPPAAAGRASWLIFADRGGVGDALSALLEARGERSLLVARGESYEQTDSEHFRIRPDEPEDVRRLFDVALSSDRPACRGVVHLWSLDLATPEEPTATSLDAAERQGCASVLLLVQELARAEALELPRLWLVTLGAQAAGEEGSPLSVAQAPLWGLGRVIAQEHPNIWGGLVDLEPGPSTRDASARQLCEEISIEDGEDQIAYRQGRRYVGRLVRRRSSAKQTHPIRWRTDGSYLISGGLGDLGLLVARWMVEQGARRLILLARTRLPPRANWASVDAESHLAHQIAAIRELEAMGATVHLAPVDVADEGSLSGFLNEFRADGWPPIRGVVHAAGVLQDGLLVQLDAAAFKTVLRPKVTGGWLLHRLLEADSLDFFVLFSSAASVLGQPGQGNYAAANAFLDALAYHRQAQGQPALSINWGAWTGEGFADSVGGKRLSARLGALGIGSIAPPQALEALGRLLGQSAAQVVAVPVRWKQFREVYSAGRASPLLSALAGEDVESAQHTAGASERRDALLAAEPAERRRLLQSYLSDQVARVLGLAPSELDLHQSLSYLGLDSLMAIELKNRIAVDLKVNLPVARFLQGFSVDQAIKQVLNQLSEETANPVLPLPLADTEPRDDASAAHLLANLDQLTEEEVDSLLVDMLGNEKDGS